MPKISELNAITNVANNDLLMVVHDPGGLPSTNKITVNNFITSLSSSIVDSTLALIPDANTTVSGTVKVGSGLSSNSSGFLNSVVPSGGLEGQVLLTGSGGIPYWYNSTGAASYLLFNSSNNYTATANDYLIFCDPANLPGDITISLPLNVEVGKRYVIKNLNTGSGNDLKVRVTTTTGGSNYLESPITQQFVAYHDIVNLNDSEEWVYDGDYGYRHLGSTTNSPVFTLDANTFHQVAIQNYNSGTAASGDLVVYSDTGSYAEGTGPFVDIGINSSNYTDTTYGNVWGPDDAYLYNQGGNLIIGPQTDHTIKFVAGNTNTEDVRMTVNSSSITVNSNITGPDYFVISTPLISNTKYAETYYGGNSGYWGGYVEKDVPGGNNSWAWIETNLSDINNPYVLIENQSDDGTSKTWKFNRDGSITLPSESHVGYRYNSTITGRTLRLSDDLTNEVVITGPSPNSSYSSSQRIVIQGQRGYGTWGQNVAGEGGDIYIWAGVGGESDTNVGGSGGDIKVRGGQGQDNEGGYVRIEAGDAAHWSGTAPGNGGFIEITAGDVIESGGDANNVGGDITISAGRARSDSTKSGAIRIRAGGNVNYPTQHEWIFGANNVLTLPANSDIKNSDGFSVIKSIPQNQQSGFSNYTLQLSDAGKHIYKDDGDGYGVEIPTDATTAFEIGTVITIVSGNGWTYIYPADGMTTELWGAGFNQTSTSFYIPNNSMATLLKIGTDKWMLSGAGLAID